MVRELEDELVLVTSYFNLADGRRQDTADSFRVDPNLPSRTSPDGAAALYVVTEASTGGHMGPRARRVAADTVAWEYSSRGDDPAAARLRAALRTAHEEVLREFEGHVTVGMTVLVVEKDTVYLGQVSPAQVYVLHAGNLSSMTAGAGGSSPFSKALGTTGNPSIQVFRDQIEADDILCLCSSWFQRAADQDEVRNCFGAGTADDIADALLNLAQQHDVQSATAVVVEAALSDEVDQEPEDVPTGTLMEQVDTAVQTLAGMGRQLWSELLTPTVPEELANGQGGAEAEEAEPDGPAAGLAMPERRRRVREQHTIETPLVDEGATQAPEATAEPAEPPVDVHTGGGASAAWIPPEEAGDDPGDTQDLSDTRYDVPSSHPDPISYAPPEEPAEEPLDEPSATQDLSEVGHRFEEQATDEVEAVSARSPSSSTREPESGSRPVKPPPAPVDQASELDAVNSRLNSGPDMADVLPPVQAFPEPSTTEPERIYATSKDVEAVNKRRPRRFGGISGSGKGDALSGPPVVTPGSVDLDIRRPVARAAPPAVIWAAIAIVCVLAAGALLIFYKGHQHTTAANNYPSLARKDIALAKSAKTPANQTYYLNRASRNITLARQHGSSTKTVSSLRQDLQTTSDTIYQVSRVKAATVAADFSQFPHAAPAQLATSTSLVFTLDSGRHSVFSVTPGSKSPPTEIVQDGETVTGIPVGVPTQLTNDGPTALVLDDKANLVSDNNGTKAAQTLAQPASTSMHSVAMASVDPDVYILDTANSQVWRYPGAAGGLSPPPQGFFPTAQPKLKDGAALTMDGTSMWILEKSGAVMKFDMQAHSQPFSMTLRLPLKNPDAIYTDQGLNYVWIADPGNQRIVQVDKTGRYVRSYASGSSGIDFTQIKSVAVPPGGKLVYVLTNTKLYSFPVIP